MTDTSGPISSYALGHTEHELRRLTLQGQYWADVTAQLLRRAGIGPGMRVLDVGSGAGDVSFMAADLVGPSGSVLGIDRSEQAARAASARATALGIDHVAFEVAEVATLERSRPFDAIIGRFVLMYMADPAATLRGLVDTLNRPGVVAFLELDMRTARAVPPVASVEKVLGWVRDTFERSGAALSLGPRLWRTFQDAGLPAPELVVCQKLEPPTAAAGPAILAGLVRSLLPMMEKFGVATAADVDVEGLADELHRALAREDSMLFTPCVVGAYARC